MAETGKDTFVASNQNSADPSLLGVNEPGGWGLPDAFGTILNAAGKAAGAVYNVAELFKSPGESVNAQTNVSPEPATKEEAAAAVKSGAPPGQGKGMLLVLALIAGGLLLALKMD